MTRKTKFLSSRRGPFLATLLAGSAVLAAGSAHAANLMWTGPATGGDLFDSANWSTSGVGSYSDIPADGDFLFFGHRPDLGYVSLEAELADGQALQVAGGGGFRIGFRGAFVMTLNAAESGGGVVNTGQTHIGRWDAPNATQSVEPYESHGTLHLNGVTWNSEVETLIGIGASGAPREGYLKRATGTMNLNDGGDYNHSGGGSFRLGSDQGQPGEYEGTININGVGNVLSVTNAAVTVQLGLGDTAGSGGSGLGTLNLNGGLVDLNTDVTLGIGNGGTGVLNLGNGADASTFRARAVSGGTGTSVINFNGVTYEAVEDGRDLVSGVGTATVEAGGVTFDARGLSVGSTQAFTGSGAITLMTSEEAESAFAFNGSHTGGLQVQENVRLTGEFTLGGHLSTAPGSVFAVGNSIGSANVDSATLEGLFEVEVDGNLGDFLAVTGDLDIDNATLSLVQLGAVTEDIVFVSYGSLVGAGAFASVDGLQTGWSIDYAYNGGDEIALVIPEPSTYALIGGIGILAFALIRRNRRSGGKAA